MFDGAGRFLTAVTEVVDCDGRFLTADVVFPRAPVMWTLRYGTNGSDTLGALLEELFEKRVWLRELTTGAAMPTGVRRLLHTAAPVARTSPSSSEDDGVAEGERLSPGCDRLPNAFDLGFLISK